MKKIKEKINLIKFTLYILFTASKPMFLSIFLISIILSLIVPGKLLIWRQIINELVDILSFDSTNYNSIITLLICHFILSAVRELLQDILIYIQAIYGEYINKKINIKLLNKAIDLNMEFYDSSENYNLLNKASSQALNNSMGLLMTLINLVQATIISLSVSVLIIQYSPLTFLLCVLTTVPLFIFNNKFMNKMFDIFNEKFETLRFIESLKSLMIKNKNIKEIKVFQSGNYIIKKISELYEKNIRTDKKVRKSFLFKSFFYSNIDIISTYLVKGYVFIIGIVYKRTVGLVLTTISSIDELKNQVSNLMSMIVQASENLMYVNYLYEFLNIEVNIKENESFNSLFKKIEFKDVSFKYPGTKKFVLKNFNFKFYNDSSYVIVGFNGSGKSTLVKLLLGLYKPTSGKIMIDDIDLEQINKKEYYSYISAVFQDFVRYPFDIETNINISNLSMYEDESYINNLYRDIIIEATRLTNSYNFIQKLPNQFKTQLIKGWKESVEISGGEWQKIAISRALVKQSNLIILDEPTASLDIITEKDIFERLNKINSGKLYVLITHRLFSIKSFKEILVMNDGNLVETGDHQTLMEKGGIYYNLYTTYKEN